MSLAITAVTPLAIVVGADSAVTSEMSGEEVVLTAFPKILLRHKPVQVFAIIGTLRIGAPGADSWVHLWMRQFLDDLAPTTNLAETAQELAATLNQSDLSIGGDTAMLGAAWERMIRVGDTGARTDTGIFAPQVWEISSGKNGGDFGARQILSEDDQEVMVRSAAKGGVDDEGLFQVRLFHAGIPRGYGTWIIGDGRERFAAFAGTQLPEPSTEGVEEYVRFAIKLAADLYAVSAQPRYVAEPIHTAILFPLAARPTVIRSIR